MKPAKPPESVQALSADLNADAVASLNNTRLSPDIIESINHVRRLFTDTEYGRPALAARKKLTPEQVDSIRYLAMHGAPAEEIAEHVGIHVRTLYRRYDRVMEEGRRKLRIAIRRAQFKRAIVDESDYMLTHMGKLYCNQSQPLEVQLHAEVSGQLQHEHNFAGLTREQLADQLQQTRKRILETGEALTGLLANSALDQEDGRDVPEPAKHRGGPGAGTDDPECAGESAGLHPGAQA